MQKVKIASKYAVKYAALLSLKLFHINWNFG